MTVRYEISEELLRDIINALKSDCSFAYTATLAEKLVNEMEVNLVRRD